MTIRECSVSDYESIHALNKNALGNDYPLEKTRSRLSEILKRRTDILFVACIDGAVVGYIHGCDYECTYWDPVKNILALAVDEAYRGRGVGRVLLEAIETWAKTCGCRAVRLVSAFSRTGAHAFYLHCGYINRKDQKNFIKLFDQ